MISGGTRSAFLTARRWGRETSNGSASKEDHAIVGRELEGENLPTTSSYVRKKKYENFDLRLEAKLVGAGQNAGIQFRSRAGSRQFGGVGYQADVGVAWDRPVWGAIYDESRRRKMLAEPDPELAKRMRQDRPVE